MVRQLEQQHDAELGLAATEFTHLPTGDEIAAELERFPARREPLNRRLLADAGHRVA